MSKPSYAELLRDPRWQKKRLEVMQRDSFTCNDCGSSKHTLNVHHIHYIRGHNPWEYPSAGLVTLCEDCHSLKDNNLGDKIALEIFMCGFGEPFMANLMIGFHYLSQENIKEDEREIIEAVFSRILLDCEFRKVITKSYNNYLVKKRGAR